MDNFRLILLLSLGAVLFLIYQAWLEDYGRVAPIPAETPAPAAADAPSTLGERPDMPSDAPSAPAVPTTQTASSADDAAAAQPA
jgi:YidC/Oxa1 family membrane protein insertase